VTRVPTIDLFAGAGGLSIAAAAAGGDVRLHVEIDPVACDTLRSNPKHHSGDVLEADVGDLEGSELREHAGLRGSDPLIVVGGPPCQPFSKAAFWSEDGDDAAYRRARAEGRSAPRPRKHGHKPDDRRFLVDDFLRLVVESKADAFLFENVASLLAPRNKAMLEGLLAKARRGGFATTVIRANAVAYGVPQKRERVFVIGGREAVPVAPEPTHALEPTIDLKPAVTAGEALSPFNDDSYFEPEEVVKGRWAEHLKTVPPGWNYKAHTAWGGHPQPTFVTETRFWNFLLKLSPDMPSWTIPANPGPWTGPFHWDTRRLRTPELAALQAFPRGYRFAGSRRERVRQIGNAAPPPLAKPMVAAALATVGAVADETLAWTA
jgi:DNA (cytosine-5)-methyltransferase 1